MGNVRLLKSYTSLFLILSWPRSPVKVLGEKCSLLHAPKGHGWWWWWFTFPDKHSELGPIDGFNTAWMFKLLRYCNRNVTICYSRLWRLRLNFLQLISLWLQILSLIYKMHGDFYFWPGWSNEGQINATTWNNQKWNDLHIHWHWIFGNKGK